MVGRAMVAHCRAHGDEVFAHDRRSLDVTDESAIHQTFTRERPDTIINCAAWTDVDGCETNAGRAYAVNALAVEKLALGCRDIGASFLTISTDYIFDGEKDGFYTQRDDPRPASIYAAAKLDGERRAQVAFARTVVVRTGWVFGSGGTNFLSRVIELAREGARLRAISDAYGTPTFADDLAKRLRELAELDLPGVYHVVNSGAGASYEEFARAAVTASGCEAVEIERVSMNSLNRLAPRPRNSRLRCLLSEAIGLPEMPAWEDALKRFAAHFAEEFIVGEERSVTL